MNFIKGSESCHWYTRGGKPKHDANMRQAKKEKLLPSVTSICNIMSNHGLESWKLNELLLASLTLTQEENESVDDFAKRIVEDSKKTGQKAAKIGTALHGIIARYIEGKKIFYKGVYYKLCEPVFEWIDENIAKDHNGRFIGECEKPTTFGDYAGTVDFKGKLKDGRKCTIDWKSKDMTAKWFKKNGELYANKLYDNYIMQLTAYDRKFFSKETALINGYISRNLENPMFHAHEWSYGDSLRGLSMWHSAKELYISKNKMEYLYENS